MSFVKRDHLLVRRKVGIAALVLGGFVSVTFSPSAAVSGGSQTEVLITVTTSSDASNGVVSSVAELLATPGRDGISLHEVIEATNNDPGRYTIRFSRRLRGKSIVVSGELPPLTGGGVSIEGQGVMLRSAARQGKGLTIASSGNRLQGLTLEGFETGVLIQLQPPGPLTRRTLSDIVVSDLVMRGIGNAGIFVVSAWSSSCGIPRPRPCRSFNTIRDTVITGNSIEARHTGIKFALGNSGDRLERAFVTENGIRISTSEDMGIGVELGADAGDDRTPALISDVLIARNRVAGSAGAGISVGSGVQRAQGNLTRRVRVLNNRVHLVRRGPGFCCKGIWVHAGAEAPDGIYPGVRPLRYPDRNVVRDVVVRGNSVTGTLEWGVSLHAGTGAGGSWNRAEDIHVVRNTIRSTLASGHGVFLSIGDGQPLRGRYAVANRITKVRIASNAITVPGGAVTYRPSLAAAILLLGGGDFGRDGSVRNVVIANNRIATPQSGIKLVGGVGPTAERNRVSCVRVSGNRVNGAPARVSVIGNEGGVGNHVTLGC